ncbi:helix-turn-helix domain-containing protein [Ciceribacter sp. L1K22]|uniref:Crp/Fnr family transcriptional regulator n=1 Tax=Ciceribacter sp. L1K22 TaxID=2820275 RepID=UPI001FEE14B2|nr:helix-turn-helix domain-containing protein [Ciceribacter sp. L1K22]
MYNRTHLGDPSPILPIDYVMPFAERQGSIRSRLVSPRTTILLQGLNRKATYRILDGCVALYQLLADGRKQILDILGPGRLLGAGVTDHFQCGAETLAFTHIEELGTDESGAAIDAHRQLQLLLVRSLSHATLLGRKTAPEKVASALVDLSQQFARRPKGSGRRAVTFTLHLTRADLADWLGLTLETVSRQLNGLKRSRVIDFRTPELITIKDPDRLAAIANGQSIHDNH